MKRQKKQLVSLVILLIVLAIAYIYVGKYNDEQANGTEEEIIYVTNFSTADICAFSYDYEEITYSFTKTDVTWTYDGDTTVDIDEAAVSTLLLDAAAVVAVEKLTEYEALENYGLETPKKTLTFTFTDGTVRSLIIGDCNEMLGYYYMMTNADDTLYLADSTLFDEFEISYEDLIAEEEETESTEETEAAEETETTEETTETEN